MSCSGCGTTPNLFNKFVKFSSSGPKPGPFDGVKTENRAFIGSVSSRNVPEVKTSTVMNGNGMFAKFFRNK